MAEVSREMQQLQARMEALLQAQQQRVIALEEWRANGEDLLVDTRAEGLTDVVDEGPMDRLERGEAMAELEERMHELEQARQQERSHGQGVGY